MAGVPITEIPEGLKGRDLDEALNEQFRNIAEAIEAQAVGSSVIPSASPESESFLPNVENLAASEDPYIQPDGTVL